MSYLRLKKVAAIVAITVILLLVIIFSFRNVVSRIIVNRLTNQLQANFGIHTGYNKIGFTGLRTFQVHSLSIIPFSKDTLLHIHHAEIKLGIYNLFFLKINPLEIKINSPTIYLTGGKDSSNYYKLLHPDTDSLKRETRSKEITSRLGNKQRVALLSKVIRAFFGLSTAKFIITDLHFRYTHYPFYSKIDISYLETSKEGFETLIITEEQGKFSRIKLFSITDKENNRILIRATGDSLGAQIPLIYHKLGIKAGFDSLIVDLSAKSLSSTNIEVEGQSSVSGFELESQKVSESPVMLNKGSFLFKIRITPDKYELDSNSIIRVNNLRSHIGISYLPSERRINFKLETGVFEAQNLFEALPKGLFNNLHGIQFSGMMDYSLALKINLNTPDSIKLNSNLRTEKIAIQKFGNTDFSKLNDTFTHFVYTDTGLIKSIHIGTKNPNYVPLDKISPFIKNAVITSEDGGFYYHQGFDIEGIRYAMAQNIKEGRFVRGGSTITMQLVKNIYLNQNKNLFRKFEEFLIVWIIESNKLVSKDRILEIYLNIIEWGPGIYGVKEACRYYFNKEPFDITLNEAIFLSSIVPRPTKFKFCFEKDGTLKPFMGEYYTFIGDKLYTRGIISDEQYQSILSAVELKGAAKNLLIDTSLISIDSLAYKELLESIMVKDTSLLLH